MAEHAAPKPSGRTRDDQAFIAMAISRAHSIFVPAMEHAATTGDTVVGDIASVDAQWLWRYEVTCVAYDPTGISVKAFIARVKPNEPVEVNVRVELVATREASPAGGVYLQKGTCRIRTTAGAKLYLRANQSPQSQPWLRPRAFTDAGACSHAR